MITFWWSESPAKKMSLGGGEHDEEELMLQGQTKIWKLMFAFAESMALKCAVELHIPDIINAHGHGHPLSLAQIGKHLSSHSPDLSCLSRIMLALSRKNIFTATKHPQTNETLYGLTHASKWLLQDADETTSLAPMLLMENHPLLLAPWHYFSSTILDGGKESAFEKAHGRTIWELGAMNHEFNRLFNDGLASSAKVVIDAIIKGYRDGFEGVKDLVDVGGGTGSAVAEIVRAYPHIHGINFDLPHVVETAPACVGVTHVGGNMFESIPAADALFLKWVLHDWGDDDCVKILKSCRKALEEKKGRLIIVEAALQPEGDGLFDDTAFAFDLVMIAHTQGGKERTQLEWKGLLQKGGFPACKFITIQALPIIIEAYLQ